MIEGIATKGLDLCYHYRLQSLSAIASLMVDSSRQWQKNYEYRMPDMTRRLGYGARYET